MGEVEEEGYIIGLLTGEERGEGGGAEGVAIAVVVELWSVLHSRQEWSWFNN